MPITATLYTIRRPFFTLLEAQSCVAAASFLSDTDKTALRSTLEFAAELRIDLAVSIINSVVYLSKSNCLTPITANIINSRTKEQTRIYAEKFMDLVEDLYLTGQLQSEAGRNILAAFELPDTIECPASEEHTPTSVRRRSP